MTASEALMADILDDLKSWRDQLMQNARHRTSELPEIDINKIGRAIDEITRLRAELARYEGPSIAAR